MAYYLKSLGYDVAIAADGSRALNMNLDDEIELVILDFHIPIYDGAEVMMQLRQRRLLRPIKVLAVTADGSLGVRDEMCQAGVDGFLTKPVDPQALRDEVSRLLPGLPQREGALHRRIRKRNLEPLLSSHQVDPRAGLQRDGDG